MKAMFDFSTVPLNLIFWLGLLMAIVSFGAALVSIAVKLIWWHIAEPGYTDIICAILFLSGTILFSVGVLGRYLMMIVEQTRGRPAFIVMDSLPAQPLAAAQTAAVAQTAAAAR